MNFISILEDAQSSAFGLWKFNFLLHRMIPFNKPHGLKVTQITANKAVVHIPFKKANLNHIKGLHACVQATAAEYASGLLLLSRLGFKDYRIIMESMELKYSYQGKIAANAVFELSEESLEKEIKIPLERGEVVYYKAQISVKDEKGNELCIATTNWQLKPWNKVKTKTT
jgi:acyl-coenzyme A thioesterase PaaI-like protein